MIPSVMHVWTTLIGDLAVVGIVVIAFCVMLGVIKPGDVMKHVGALVCVLILLLILPPIILNRWAVIAGVALVAILLRAMRRGHKKPRR